MMLYQELSIMSRAGYGSCIMILMVAAMFLFIAACVQHMEYKYRILSAFLTLVIVFILQGVFDLNNNLFDKVRLSFLGESVGKLPCVLFAGLLLFIAVLEIILFVFIRRSQKNRMTSGAIKESLDALPDGVCFYDADGQPLLVNMQMQYISGELFGSEILNAERFFRRLECMDTEKNTQIIRTQPTVRVRTKDGKVWDFHRGSLEVGHDRIRELVAYDVTEQYRLGQELEKRNQSLSQINERLRLYSQEVERITREKEILTAKVRVHDDVGRSLLAFRSYLAQPEEKRDRGELLLMWRHNVEVLRQEAAPDEKSDEWKLLLKAAEAVDVTLVLEGELPEDEKEREILITACHECLTNTVKHANDNRLCISIKSCDRGLIARFTNNGDSPAGEIRETGGLKNLRRMTEQEGGIMTIESIPQFVLQIELYAGGEMRWQKQK